MGSSVLVIERWLRCDTFTGGWGGVTDRVNGNAGIGDFEPCQAPRVLWPVAAPLPMIGVVYRKPLLGPWLMECSLRGRQERSRSLSSFAKTWPHLIRYGISSKPESSARCGDAFRLDDVFTDDNDGLLGDSGAAMAAPPTDNPFTRLRQLLHEIHYGSHLHVVLHGSLCGSSGSSGSG